MKKINNIREIIVSLTAFSILIWAFFKNQILGKIIIIPFLICSLAIFFKNVFLLLNKERISNVFKIIFRISFFTYVFGFLIYLVYYAITTKTYSLFIIIGIFIIGAIRFFKMAFFKKNK